MEVALGANTTFFSLTLIEVVEGGEEGVKLFLFNIERDGYPHVTFCLILFAKQTKTF